MHYRTPAARIRIRKRRSIRNTERDREARPDEYVDARIRAAATRSAAALVTLLPFFSLAAPVFSSLSLRDSFMRAPLRPALIYSPIVLFLVSVSQKAPVQSAPTPKRTLDSQGNHFY